MRVTNEGYISNLYSRIYNQGQLDPQAAKRLLSEIGERQDRDSDCCPICLEYSTDMITPFECQHPLNRACVIKLQNRGNLRFVCPLCRNAERTEPMSLADHPTVPVSSSEYRDNRELFKQLLINLLNAEEGEEGEGGDDVKALSARVALISGRVHHEMERVDRIRSDDVQSLREELNNLACSVRQLTEKIDRLGQTSLSKQVRDAARALLGLLSTMADYLSRLVNLSPVLKVSVMFLAVCYVILAIKRSAEWLMLMNKTVSAM